MLFPCSEFWALEGLWDPEQANLVQRGLFMTTISHGHVVQQLCGVCAIKLLNMVGGCLEAGQPLATRPLQCFRDAGNHERRMAHA